MSLLRDPLWRRAPVALVRFPAVLAGIATGSALLALAAASNPFFVSASATAALEHELADVTAYGAGPSITVTDRLYTSEPTWTPRDRALDRSLGRIHGLGPRLTTILAPEVAAGNAEQPANTLEVRLLAKTGVLRHVRTLGQVRGEGIWLADSAAEELRLAPGDRVELGLGTTPRTVSVRVKGLYRALKLERPTPYWRSLYNQIYPGPPAYAEVPTFALADERSLLSLGSRLGLERAFFRWEFPLSGTRLTVPEAERIDRDLDHFQRALGTPETPLRRIFECDFCFRSRIEYASRLPTAVANAKETAATVRGPIDLLSNAGTLVALAVVAAAAGFTLARRRVEAALLYARGASPVGVGARLAVESLLPALVGALIGLGLGFLLVEALRPGRVAEEALADGAIAAAVRLPAALVIVALVAALGFRRGIAADAPRRRGLRGVPWEVGALALAAFFLVKLLEGDAFVAGAEEGVARPSFYLLLFPIVFLAGVAGLVARALLRAIAAWRRRGSGSSSEAAYLAASRLAASGPLAVLLVTASTVALGIFVYAETVVSSYRDTVRASSLLSTGSDVQGQVSFDREAPDDLPFPTTKATRLSDAGTAHPSGISFDLLAVDSPTVAAAVHWDEAYASKPLDEIAAELSQDGSELPVVLIGAESAQVKLIELDGLEIPVRVIETARAFPGMSRSRPVVVADETALLARFDRAGVSNLLRTATFSEIWAKGAGRETARRLATSSARPFPVLTAEEVQARPEVTAFTRTFAFLEALGLGAGVLAVVGVVLYLQVRQRGRVVAYGIARRMGLTAGSHLRALAVELAIALLVALALGFGLALIAARLVLGEVEPLASISPVPLFRPPWLLAAPLVAAIAGLAYAGAAVANRAAERARLAEVMRIAE